jgi:hypothetical protein
VEPDDLDELLDLGLRAAQADEPAVCAQAAGEHREVEHERQVGEHELGEVDDHIGLRAQGTGQGAAARSLGGSVLVADAAKPGGSVIEDDDS